MRRSDHIHIIGSISDGQCDTFRIFSPHHFDHLCLLFGRHTTSENHICPHAQFNEFIHQTFVVLDCGERFSCDHHSIISSLLGDFLLRQSVIDLNPNPFRLSFLQNEHVHFLGQKLASYTNVDRSFDLIPSEDPQLHTRLLNVIDCAANFLLQLVFDRRRPQQFETDFYFFGHLIDLLLFVQTGGRFLVLFRPLKIGLLRDLLDSNQESSQTHFSIAVQILLRLVEQLLARNQPLFDY